MILKNPDKGAPIKISVEGKIWELLIGKTLEFTDSVGVELKKIYGFLEEIKSVDASVEQNKEGYYCTACSYTNKAKIAVLGHLRGHTKVLTEKAVPIGDAKVNPTVFEARNARLNNPDELPAAGVDKDGIEWYGDGYEEKRQFQNATAHQPGRFTA